MMLAILCRSEPVSASDHRETSLFSGLLLVLGVNTAAGTHSGVWIILPLLLI